MYPFWFDDYVTFFPGDFFESDKVRVIIPIAVVSSGTNHNWKRYRNPAIKAQKIEDALMVMEVF